MELFRRTFADIDIENLIHNWCQIKAVAGEDRFVCAMVKANAYGHGAAEISRALESEGAKSLGVCLIEEGLQLRAEGIKGDILIFKGFDKRGAEKILENQMTPVVSTWPQVYLLEAAADEPVKVHLKFNTGMNRIGFNADQAADLVSYFKKTKKLKLKAVCTHLLSSDHDLIAKQLALFTKIKEQFSQFDIYDHVLNSGGIADFAKNPAAQGKWGFRPGLMLYGYQPAVGFSELELKPVMSVKSVINNIQDVPAGQTVSYNGTWKAPRLSRIAVVPVGYGDGIHRVVSNRASILLAGKRAPIVGTICMDFLMADVTDIIGSDNSLNWNDEEITLLGYDEKNNLISADELAQQANTISWEILTSIGQRVPRHFKGIKKS